VPKTATPPPKRSGRPLLNYQGAAEYLGLKESHVRRMVAEGRLPHSKLGRTPQSPVRFDPDELDQWITSTNVPASA
jgi:excisionase family DNA binding protein